jgi:hypothetical protein
MPKFCNGNDNVQKTKNKLYKIKKFVKLNRHWLFSDSDNLDVKNPLLKKNYTFRPNIRFL